MRFGILSPCTYSEKAARLQFYVTKRKEREKTQFLFQTIPNNRTKLARMTIDLSVKTYVKSREKERRTEIHNGWPRMRLKNLTINTKIVFKEKKITTFFKLLDTMSLQMVQLTRRPLSWQERDGGHIHSWRRQAIVGNLWRSPDNTVPTAAGNLI